MDAEEGADMIHYSPEGSRGVCSFSGHGGEYTKDSEKVTCRVCLRTMSRGMDQRVMNFLKIKKVSKNKNIKGAKHG